MFKYINYTALFLLIFSFWSSCGPDVDTAPSGETSKNNQPSESFLWMLAHHGDKVAHYDHNRSIIQIKVLNQIIHGSRQCGYHSVRNYFYLAALSEAIEKRDSALVNKLYAELHTLEHFTLFVTELANIKGCPISHFHESEPDAMELRALYQAASITFPSSLSIEQIIKYGVVKNNGNHFRYWKNPPIKNESNKLIFKHTSGNYFKFLQEMKEDFSFGPMISANLNALLELPIGMPEYFVELYAHASIEQQRAFPIYIYLEGSPAHAVVASVFQPKDEKLPTLLFADSWGDLSFLTGWSKSTIDVFYKLLTQVDDAKNRALLHEALMRFERLDLFRTGPQQVKGQLADLLATAKTDPTKRQEILDRLAEHLKEFDEAVKEFALEQGSLYPTIKALIDKIATTYRDALQ